MLAATLGLAACGLALATGLTVNTNQLDMIDPALPEVVDAMRLNDMVGGVGTLMVALRGGDPARLKAAADDLGRALEADPRVRRVIWKLPAGFVRERAAMFLKTEDLQEVRKRGNAWIRDAIKRASPLFFELRRTEPLKFEVDDILARYATVGKKRIADDYYASADGRMLLLLVKPIWHPDELGRTGELVAHIRSLLAQERGGLRFVEDYEPTPPAVGAGVVEFGFSGRYQTNYDDSFLMKASLPPITLYALGGVFLVLLAFFGRRIGSVAIMLGSLGLGMALAFGFARVAVGQLNMITMILGGILTGLGVDFGIHLLVRLRDELSGGAALPDAVRTTVEQAGLASLVSAVGTGAAFGSLLMSDFAGFSDFGLLSGVGVVLIGGAVYAATPASLLLLDRRFPGLALRLIRPTRGPAPADSDRSARRIPRPGLLLVLALGLAAVLASGVPQARFSYDNRLLNVEDQPSILLQDEVAERMGLASDPAAVFTPTLEASGQVQALLRSDPDRFSTVGDVVSIHDFLPPAHQQRANSEVLGQWRAELADIDRSALPPEVAGHWDEATKWLHARPFTYDDLPTLVRELFTHDPGAKPDNHGFLTLVYPVKDFWDTREMMKFTDQTRALEVPAGTFRTAGAPMLFSKLCRIVLHDGKATVGLTALLLLLILAIDLRRPVDVALTCVPLAIGFAVMLGVAARLDVPLNYMNLVTFPVILGYGVSHGVYLVHRFREGASAYEAVTSVGKAVACSTLTTIAAWAALLAASHGGLHSIGVMACIGMLSTLTVTMTVMPPLLQLLDDRR